MPAKYDSCTSWHGMCKCVCVCVCVCSAVILLIVYLLFNLCSSSLCCVCVHFFYFNHLILSVFYYSGSLHNRRPYKIIYFVSHSWSCVFKSIYTQCGGARVINSTVSRSNLKKCKIKWKKNRQHNTTTSDMVTLRWDVNWMK